MKSRASTATTTKAQHVPAGEPDKLGRGSAASGAGLTAQQETTSASGTLSSHGDMDELPVADEGLSVAPEDLGRQFLRDATEQDNFESELDIDDVEMSGPALGDSISEASLREAGQPGVEVPESAALMPSRVEGDLEPRLPDVDLSTGVVHEGSLFDRPADQLDEDVREPENIRADDSEQFESGKGIDEEARENEMERTRRTLQRGRGGATTDARVDRDFAAKH